MYGLINGSGDKMIDVLRGVSKKTKSKAAKELLRNKESQAACDAADQLFHEAMEMYKEGDMSWEEAISDLAENLRAIPMSKEKKGE